MAVKPRPSRAVAEPSHALRRAAPAAYESSLVQNAIDRAVNDAINELSAQQVSTDEVLSTKALTLIADGLRRSTKPKRTT